jgi:hypothetical protein
LAAIEWEKWRRDIIGVQGAAGLQEKYRSKRLIAGGKKNGICLVLQLFRSIPHSSFPNRSGCRLAFQVFWTLYHLKQNGHKDFELGQASAQLLLHPWNCAWATIG